MFTLKRKNDEKTKHRSRILWVRDLLALFLIVFLMAGGVLWLTRPIVPYSPYPPNLLSYTSQGTIKTLNLQTGQRTDTGEAPVISIEGLPAPVQSPDARWLAYWTLESQSRTLVVRGVDVTDNAVIISIPNFTGPNMTLSWSPDSQSIIFSANPPSPETTGTNMQDEELFLVTVPTGKIERLTNNRFAGAVPDFSPDGTQIVYVSSADGYYRLYIMDLETGKSRLVSSEVFGFSPVWSPDGQWIAYITDEDGQGTDIWIVRPNGKSAQGVVQGPEDDRDPVWLP